MFQRGPPERSTCVCATLRTNREVHVTSRRCPSGVACDKVAPIAVGEASKWTTNDCEVSGYLSSQVLHMACLSIAKAGCCGKAQFQGALRGDDRHVHCRGRFVNQRMVRIRGQGPARSREDGSARQWNPKVPRMMAGCRGRHCVARMTL